ncbi:hypothetical protein SEA_PHLOP_4 [Gordonia phage Phlop]|uniref:Uncharacterized protein n=4 Tax=Wizardvirus TaxID=2169658 RepID=A0A4Y5U0B3_9CAUD|nr:hypothetical protein BH794_gp04 [Gordonia phage Wizard]YP_010102255.1 hypothetical protein KNU56_gp04 [Gordonia phage Arri]YP_010104218.1 hypothetical protein KNU74_gp04 [Gordonia phage Fireball]YP_010114923.1 hypothetical protein KNV78_gp04 [Gordonia phage Phlop]UVK63716.1 hypothetical protein SEA_PULLUMCAVEA_4 [Gordonia phage PullumCavea]ANA85310.1 hypothetical protein WIZARD_4 [Gordonia phage Wizard]QDB74781.1 hypothetical protein SEA_ARRI_4 [Gordonia phage Arri]QFP95829.1 hypothetical
MSTADLWWWDVLGALALSVPLYWASSRAGHRWAQWRDLRRQEREIDRREQNRDLEEIMQAWDHCERERQNTAAIRAGRGVVSLDVPPPPVVPPPPPTASGGVGVPDSTRWTFADVGDGTGRLVRLDSPADFDDWGSSDTVLG